MYLSLKSMLKELVYLANLDVGLDASDFDNLLLFLKATYIDPLWVSLRSKFQYTLGSNFLFLSRYPRQSFVVELLLKGL